MEITVLQLVSGALGIIVTFFLGFVAKELHSINQSIIDLNVKLAQYISKSDNHGIIVEDHEKRLRELEKRR